MRHYEVLVSEPGLLNGLNGYVSLGIYRASQRGSHGGRRPDRDRVRKVRRPVPLTLRLRSADAMRWRG
jgi:hypothetical protein